MKALILALAVGYLGWQAYADSLDQRSQIADGLETVAISAPAASRGTAGARSLPVASRFSCDGRTHCSQMTSCAEATYFLRHCPGVKMDGNNDGVPCERQWCN